MPTIIFCHHRNDAKSTVQGRRWSENRPKCKLQHKALSTRASRHLKIQTHHQKAQSKLRSGVDNHSTQMQKNRHQTAPADTQHKKGGEATMGKTTLYNRAKSYAQPSTYALTRRPKSEEGRGVR